MTQAITKSAILDMAFAAFLAELAAFSETVAEEAGHNPRHPIREIFKRDMAANTSPDSEALADQFAGWVDPEAPQSILYEIYHTTATEEEICEETGETLGFEIVEARREGSPYWAFDALALVGYIRDEGVEIEGAEDLIFKPETAITRGACFTITSETPEGLDYPVGYIRILGLARSKTSGDCVDGYKAPEEYHFAEMGHILRADDWADDFADDYAAEFAAL